MNKSEIAERAARQLCRELYDRFVMGGWEPPDAYDQAATVIERAIEESRGQRWIPVEEKLPEENEGNNYLD